MTTKESILEEIKRLANKNGGKPLGLVRFEKETGINSWEWGKYWPRFGDAQKEAGFKSNQLQGAYPDSFILEKLIKLIRRLQKFPTSLEIRVEKNNDSELPDRKVFSRLGKKEQLAAKIIDYCKEKTGYDDVIGVCQSILLEKYTDQDGGSDANINLGEVYLFKSGRYYKIGKTNDTVRRGSELRIQLPEKLDLIHSIKTDDPSGVEAYWHRRFEAQRLKGEWFDLRPSDIKAFKRWRKIY